MGAYLMNNSPWDCKGVDRNKLMHENNDKLNVFTVTAKYMIESGVEIKMTYN